MFLAVLFRMNQGKGNRGALYELLQPAIFAFPRGAGTQLGEYRKGQSPGSFDIDAPQRLYIWPTQISQKRSLLVSH